jgi:hypothetical protein
MATLPNDIANLDTRIAGLKANIARRVSQQGAAPSEGVYSDTSKHIDAARRELRQAQRDLIEIKCETGAWDPDELIRRMRLMPGTPV